MRHHIRIARRPEPSRGTRRTQLAHIMPRTPNSNVPSAAPALGVSCAIMFTEVPSCPTALDKGLPIVGRSREGGDGSRAVRDAFLAGGASRRP